MWSHDQCPLKQRGQAWGPHKPGGAEKEKAVAKAELSRGKVERHET